MNLIVGLEIKLVYTKLLCSGLTISLQGVPCNL